MSSVVKIIIKDRFTNKLIALKLKQETFLQRVISILQKRYEHLQEKSLTLYFRDEELELECPLYRFIEENNYTEKDRLEIREKVQEDFVEMMSKGGKSFDQAVARILVLTKVIDSATADSCMGRAEQLQKSLITTLIEDEQVSEKAILDAIGRQLEITSIQVKNRTISPGILKVIPQDIADHYCVLPVQQEGDVITVAIANPFDAEKLHDLNLITGREIEPVLATEVSIRTCYKELYERQLEESSIAEPVMNPEEPLSIGGDLSDDEQNLWGEQSWDEQSGIPFEDPDEESAPKEKRKTLIIKDGKKLSEDEFSASAEQCDAPTIWEDANKIEEKDDDWVESYQDWGDKEDLPAPDVDGEIEAGEGKAVDPGQIWDAPTFIARKEELQPIEDEEDSGEQEPSDSIDMNELLSGKEEEQKEEIPSQNEEESLGEEIPVRGGLPGEEMSATSEPDHSGETPDEEEQQREFSEKEPLADPGMDFDLAADELGKGFMTEEDMDLERTIRNELLDSRIMDYASKKSIQAVSSQPEIQVPVMPTTPTSVEKPVVSAEKPPQESAPAQIEPSSQNNAVVETTNESGDSLEDAMATPITISPEKSNASLPGYNQILAGSQEKIKRHLAVSYYQRMRAFRSFPMSIVIAKKELAKQALGKVQTTAREKLEISPDKPLLKVIPHIPGCLVTPAEAVVDATPETANLQMWVTPLAEGTIKDAHIEIWQNNKCLKRVDLAMKVVSQKPARLSVACGVLLPVATFFYEVFAPMLLEKSPQTVYVATKYIESLAKPIGGMFHFGLMAGAFFMLLSMFSFILRRSKSASPIVDMLP